MSLADDFPKLVVDQDAETLKELLKDWTGGETGLRKFIAKMIGAGKWEQVHKSVETKPGMTQFVRAYRRVKVKTAHGKVF